MYQKNSCSWIEGSRKKESGNIPKQWCWFLKKMRHKNLPRAEKHKKALEDIHSELLYTLPHKHWNGTGMTVIPRKYITDAKNQKQAVIVDLETFNRMESIIEDNGLAQFMEEADEDETLSVHEAKKHYRSLKKG
jgi:hypothetical protein